jgi:ubiquitin-protein ligase
MKEQSETSKLTDPTMVIYPKESDILLWFAFLFGPEDSPYQDGIFKVFACDDISSESQFQAHTQCILLK